MLAGLPCLSGRGLPGPCPRGTLDVWGLGSWAAQQFLFSACRMYARPAPRRAAEGFAEGDLNVSRPEAFLGVPNVRYRTPAGWYAYDGPTNRILRMSPEMFDILALYDDRPRAEVLAALSSTYPPRELDDAYQCIDRLVREQGILTGRPIDFWGRYSDTGEVRAQLAKGAGQCILEVTQRCNMRCAYCTFSGGYAFHRTHSGADMDWPTAKAAVDLLAARDLAFDGPFVSLGFHGGEPLLRFDLIRQVIEYATSKPSLTALNLCFSMTTNGTLLHDDVIRYLAKSEVTLLISLDGPREIHDRNRVFADGSPTFDGVMRNVQRVRKLEPGYFRQRVSFSITVAPDTDLLLLRGFLEESDLFQPYRIRVSYVVPGNPHYASAHPACPDRNRQQQALFDEFMRSRIDGQTPSRLAVALFEPAFVRLHKRTVFRGPVTSAVAGGACFPGGRKMYVASDGTLHICEKMNPHFAIGDVYAGLDAHRISRVLSEYQAIVGREDCRGCWAFRLCPTCFSTVDGPARFCAPNHAECDAFRAAALHDLAAYCAAQECNADVWAYLDAYTVG